MPNCRIQSAKIAVFAALLFASLSVISYVSGIDLSLASTIYALEHGNSVAAGFPLNRNFLLYDVVHEGGKTLVRTLYGLNIIALIGSCFIARLKPYRFALLYTAISIFISTGVVSELKHTTTLPCPKDLTLFGGNRGWVPMWKMFSPNLPVASCFPAGHASGGYAWLCLALLFPFGTKAFYRALLPGLFLGLIFGFAQQFRGDHFLSHDLMTIAVTLAASGVVMFVLNCLSDVIENYRLQRLETD